MNCAHSAPKGFFAHFLKRLETSLKLATGHVQQFKNVACLLFPGLRAYGSRVSSTESGSEDNVSSVCDSNNLMLWLIPFQTNRRISPRSRCIDQNSIRVLFIAQLRVVFLHTDAAPQGLERLAILLQLVQDGADQTSALPVCITRHSHS